MQPPAPNGHRIQVQLPPIEGEIVEVVERQGERLARLKLVTSVVLDITECRLCDVHLGDRLALSGRVTVERL